MKYNEHYYLITRVGGWDITKVTVLFIRVLTTCFNTSNHNNSKNTTRGHNVYVQCPLLPQNKSRRTRHYESQILFIEVLTTCMDACTYHLAKSQNLYTRSSTMRTITSNKSIKTDEALQKSQFFYPSAEYRQVRVYLQSCQVKWHKSWTQSNIMRTIASYRSIKADEALQKSQFLLRVLNPFLRSYYFLLSFLLNWS